MKKALLTVLLSVATFGAAADAAPGRSLDEIRYPPEGQDAYSYFVPMMKKVQTEEELGQLQIGCRNASQSLGGIAKTEAEARKGFALAIRCTEVWEPRSLAFCESRPFAQKKNCLEGVKMFAESYKRQAKENAEFYGVTGVK